MRARRTAESFAFEQAYGRPPEFLVMSPGRVNLLGEHTDYNGLPVLPMALDRGIRVLGCPCEGPLVRLRHLDAAYPPREFTASAQIPPDEAGDWCNYAKAAVQGLVEAGLVSEKPSGMNLLVWGDLPPAAGLSSSSALVVAVALAFLEANRRAVPRLELAELLAGAERYVGTQGGGMDQAICLLGEAGSALMIDFYPLRATPVPMPDQCAVVISHSLVRAPKTEEALLSYNRRPTECRIAAAMLARELRRAGDAANGSPRLGDLLEAQPLLLDVASELFGDGRWGVQQIAAHLGLHEDEVGSGFLTARDGRVQPEPEEGFHLLPRVRHVVTEARRVRSAYGALSVGDVAEFGAAMDASHRSCAEDYGISTPELDALAVLAREAGALGSRLTGAGFGGCVVSLVPRDQAAEVMDRLWEGYYHGYLPQCRPELAPNDGARPSLLFTAEPSQGASVERL
ncbi:MAG TPA: galactokinase [Armatimonadota bacterium]